MTIYRFSLTKNLDIQEMKGGGNLKKAPVSGFMLAGADTSDSIRRNYFLYIPSLSGLKLSINSA